MRAALALAAGALVLAGCAAPQESEEVDYRVPVTVRDVATGTVEDLVEATGTLRAQEVVQLRTESPGVLFAGRSAGGARLAEGDVVRRGQVIATVRGEDVRLAARTEATESRLADAQRDYESKKRLYDDGLISEREFRPAEAALAEARFNVERSRLTESRASLVAPISGNILRLARDEQGRPFADGQLVAQGYEVAEIGTLGTLVAEIDLIGPDLPRVRAGVEARVRQMAWVDRTFAARVVRLAPTLDPQTRALRAEVAVDNPEGLLRPGMFVEVELITDRREGVPVVPREAVTEREGTKVVFVLDGQKAVRRAVVLGYGNDREVEIREGLTAGEKLVVRGLETLTDGARVRVTNS